METEISIHIPFVWLFFSRGKVSQKFGQRGDTADFSGIKKASGIKRVRFFSFQRFSSIIQVRLHHFIGWPWCFFFFPCHKQCFGDLWIYVIFFPHWFSGWGREKPRLVVGVVTCEAQFEHTILITELDAPRKGCTNNPSHRMVVFCNGKMLGNMLVIPHPPPQKKNKHWMLSDWWVNSFFSIFATWFFCDELWGGWSVGSSTHYCKSQIHSLKLA